MRIGIEVSAAFRPKTGLEAYVMNLVDHLLPLSQATGDQFLLYWNGSYRPSSTRWPGYALRPLPQIAHDRPDVLHCTEFYLPPCPRSTASRTVVTIPDAIMAARPNFFPAAATERFRREMPGVIAQADRIITLSHHARGDIERLLGAPAVKIHVIPLGVESRFRFPLEIDRMVQTQIKYGLTDPYVLTVSSLVPRKNIPTLIRAFRHLTRTSPALTGYRLVVAARPVWGLDQRQEIDHLIGTLGMSDRVQFLYDVPDDELPFLYAGAELFVFPSLYEGFGIPPLEAMACGVPVVCSRAASLPEVVGDAALLVEQPQDPECLAAVMQQALTDGPLRERLRAAGLARAAQFRWKNAALLTLDVYRSAVG